MSDALSKETVVSTMRIVHRELHDRLPELSADQIKAVEHVFALAFSAHATSVSHAIREAAPSTARAVKEVGEAFLSFGAENGPTIV